MWTAPDAPRSDLSSLAPGILEVDDDGNLILLKDDICSTYRQDVRPRPCASAAIATAL
jgi:hypothetical protein